MLEDAGENTAIVSPDDNGVYHQRAYLKDRPEGLYTFTVKNTAETDTLAIKTLYFNQELSRKAVLGIVEIEYEGEIIYKFIRREKDRDKSK